MSTNETAASGNTLTLGDDVNTDDIIPAIFCTTADPDVLKHHALEHIIGHGKLLQYEEIHAGKNFGCGSSREHAPIALKGAGIRLVRAESFAEIFYRNSINIGLELILTEQKEVSETIAKIVESGGLNAFNRWRLDTGYQLSSSNTKKRPMTMAEKILAKASNNAYLQPNEVVFAQVDLAMSHDAVTGPVADLCKSNFGESMKVWDAEKIVLVADHFIQVNDIRSDSGAPKLLQQMKTFASEQGCHLIDEVSPGEAEGICHVLLPEKGFINPGSFIAGTDSHSCTYGAFGCFATGVGTTDMANIFATGEMWMRVPETQVLELSGTLAENISAKDIMLFILGKIGCDGAIGDVLEFRGEIIDQLPMEERMTLANMAIECGAVSGLMRIDKTTRDFLPNIDQFCNDVESDPDAHFKVIHQWDLSNLEPQIALPSQPDQVIPMSELNDVKITKAFIGSCTGGKLHDLAEAAKVLDGRKIDKNVTLFIVPASQSIKLEAERLGYLDIFSKAGATLLKSGCGACINAGPGGLSKNETGIYATNRNFKGRSGDPSAHNYLASPRSVAIAAIEGEIKL